MTPRRAASGAVGDETRRLVAALRAAVHESVCGHTGRCVADCKAAKTWLVFRPDVDLVFEAALVWAKRPDIDTENALARAIAHAEKVEP